VLVGCLAAASLGMVKNENHFHGLTSPRACSGFHVCCGVGQAWRMGQWLQDRLQNGPQAGPSERSEPGVWGVSCCAPRMYHPTTAGPISQVIHPYHLGK
jgi:hypothetical protein